MLQTKLQQLYEKVTYELVVCW